jgi:hypothetical protein
VTRPILTCKMHDENRCSSLSTTVVLKNKITTINLKKKQRSRSKIDGKHVMQVRRKGKSRFQSFLSSASPCFALLYLPKSVRRYRTLPSLFETQHRFHVTSVRTTSNVIFDLTCSCSTVVIFFIGHNGLIYWQVHLNEILTFHS